MEMYFLKMYDKNRNVTCDAKMYFFFSGNKSGSGSAVIVLPGSIMNSQEQGSKTYYKDCGNALDRLYKSKAIKKLENGMYKFIKEYKFNSPSQAAAILKGNDFSDAWLRIVNSKGESLDKLFRNSFIVKSRIKRVKNLDERLKIIVTTLSNLRFELSSDYYPAFVKNSDGIVMNIIDYVLKVKNVRFSSYNKNNNIEILSSVDSDLGENIKLYFEYRKKNIKNKDLLLKIAYAFWTILKYFNEVYVKNKSIYSIIDGYIIANTNKIEYEYPLSKESGFILSEKAMDYIDIGSSETYNISSTEVIAKFTELNETNDILKEIKNLKNILISSFSLLDKRNEHRTERVIQEINIVKNSIDDTLSIFNQLKRLYLNENDTIETIYKVLDTTELGIKEKNTILWIDDPNELEEKSKRFAFVADKIDSYLDRLNYDDKSLSVLQYCRVLENELFSKLYYKYFTMIKNNYNNGNINIFEFRNNKEEYQKFLKEIKLFSIVDNHIPKMELGSMIFILKIFLKDRESYNQVVQSFTNFINANFSSDFFQNTYIRKLGDIAYQYRNKAAHIEEMNTKYSEKAIKLIKEAINEFINYHKYREE